jgi:hypothetical protein
MLQRSKIPGYTADEIGYHAYLLVDGGLATGVDLSSFGATSPAWQIEKLTWAGHDFLDAAREEGRWTQAMAIVREKQVA